MQYFVKIRIMILACAQARYPFGIHDNTMLCNATNHFHLDHQQNWNIGRTLQYYKQIHGITSRYIVSHGTTTYSTALSAWEPEDGPGSATKLPHPCPVLLKVIKTDCLSSQNTNTQNNKYKNTTKTQGSPSLPCPLESLDCKIQIHKITNTRMQQKHKLPHSN